jgi:gluconate transporter
MTLGIIGVNLAIAIAILLVLIILLRINAVISLILAAIYMGISCSVGWVQTANTIATGFGGTMASIGLSIGMGVILGQLLSDFGGAHVIASRLTGMFPKSSALFAIQLSAFIISIPVFFDVTVVIVMPIAIAVSRQIKSPIPIAATLVNIGANFAHCFVPPTPNPLLAPSLFNFNLGTMLIVGLVIGLCVEIPMYFIAKGFYKTNFFNYEKDIDKNIVLVESTGFEGKKLPSFSVSMIPVVLPIFLILLSALLQASSESGKPPVFIEFLGNKVIALLLGAISAYLIAYAYMNPEERNKSVMKALESSGIILLITGAGGSFSGVIGATGIKDIITKLLGDGGTISVIPVLLIAWTISMIFKISMGSGTVASITTMGIFATFASFVPVHPVWIALACLGGSIAGSNVTDSGFWVVANLSGLNVRGGLKAYTLFCTLGSMIGIVATLIGATILPMR